MYKTDYILILLGLTLLLPGCKKEKTEIPSSPASFVSIEAQYPDDYFKVSFPAEEPALLVDLNTPPCPPLSAEEKKAEEIKIIERKQKEKEAAQKAAIEQKERKKENFREYLLQRAELIRLARRRTGADVLTSKSSQIEKLPPPKEPEWELSQPSYNETPTVESSYPVDRSFILTEDRTVNAVLLDSINTQIPGTVRAYVSEDVFGANHRYKLLEKGDVFIGKYDSLSKLGDTRVEVLFYRIIRAADGAQIYDDGKIFAYAADKMGRTGLVGEVDNRNWERYSGAFMTAGLGGLAGVAKSESSGDRFEEFWTRLGDSTAEITTKILEQTMNIAPVVTVAQGEPIVIRLAADIFLKRPTIKEGEEK